MRLHTVPVALVDHVLTGCADYTKINVLHRLGNQAIYGKVAPASAIGLKLRAADGSQGRMAVKHVIACPRVECVLVVEKHADNGANNGNQSHFGFLASFAWSCLFGLCGYDFNFC